MKKNLLVSLLAICLAGALAGCGETKESPAASTPAESTPVASTPAESTPVESTAESTQENSGDEVKVLSYAEYVQAEVNSVVTVQTYVQAKQSWWNDQAVIYGQSQDGAIFLYNMPVSQDDYALLTPGTKLQVTGTKSEYRGEIEIADFTDVKILSGEDTFVATPTDLTSLIASDDLINHQNEFASFKGLTVVNAAAEGEAEKAFTYKWDDSGDRGDDLYFKVSLEGTVYTFTVESYLCDKDSDVYKAVEALTIGATIDVEGFLYWYNGLNPHITKVTVLK